MRYIGDETGTHIPAFAIPPYPGERYLATVPDTLDLQERAQLAVNGLTGPTDPDKDHLLYFNASFRTNPPQMWHRGSDICQTKFEESLPLMRLASGSGLNDHVDPVWMAASLTAPRVRVSRRVRRTGSATSTSSITWFPCWGSWTTLWRRALYSAWERMRRCTSGRTTDRKRRAGARWNALCRPKRWCGEAATRPDLHSQPARPPSSVGWCTANDRGQGIVHSCADDTAVLRFSLDERLARIGPGCRQWSLDVRTE